MWAANHLLDMTHSIFDETLNSKETISKERFSISRNLRVLFHLCITIPNGRL